MSPELTYQKLLLKINKNNSGGGIACEKSVAVLLINEAKNRWVEKHLKDKDSVLIDSLQEIVKTKTLTNPSVSSDYVEYDLEEDFYEGILAKSLSKKNKCKWNVFSREVKNQNKNLLQWDENQKPSFEWEWTFHSIQGNKLRVYKSDFDILSTDFEYYSIIEDFDVSGYTHLDGTPSTDKALTVSDQYIDQILNEAAKEFQMNYENQVGVQIGQERINSQE